MFSLTAVSFKSGKIDNITALNGARLFACEKITFAEPFPLYYRILIQGGKTHPLIFIVGTNNFTEYLQSYQILIFIYYEFFFIIFIIIQYTVYVVGTLAAI